MKRLLVTLTPAQSKRLIAKGLLATEEIQYALENGYLCVTLGTTSSYLVEELIPDYDKTKHIAGVTIAEGLWVTEAESRAYDAIFYKGKYLEKKKVKDVLSDMGEGDVIIKSANALDADMVPIVLLASETGGTVGSFLGAAASKNITVIMPSGLEKCIPVLYDEFCGRFGKDDWDLAIGTPVGAIAITQGIPFTEIDALAVLFDVEAIPIAAGGVNGAEGSISLFIEGSDDDIEDAYELLKEIKKEPPFPRVEHLE